MPISRDDIQADLFEENPLSQYFKLALPLLEGAGNVVKCAVNGNYTLGGTPTWRSADSSVSGTSSSKVTINKSVFGNDFSFSANSFILMFECTRARTNSATDYTIFSWADDTPGNSIGIINYRWNDALRLNIYQKYKGKGKTFTDTRSAFDQYLIVYSPTGTGTMQIYINGTLNYSSSNFSSGYGFNLGNNPVIGLGGPSMRMRHIAFARKSGTFSAEQINSLLADPYQIYKLKDDGVDSSDKSAFWPTSNSGFKISGLQGDHTVKLTLAEDFPVNGNQYLYDGRLTGENGNDGSSTYLYSNIGTDPTNGWGTAQGTGISGIKINGSAITNLKADTRMRDAKAGDEIEFSVSGAGSQATFGIRFNGSSAFASLNISKLSITDANGEHVFDLNQEPGQAPVDVSGLSSTLTMENYSPDHLVEYQYILERQIFNSADYADLPTFIAAEKNSDSIVKEYNPGVTAGAIISDFIGGLVIDGGEITSSVSVETQGQVDLKNLKATDIDATKAADVRLHNVEAANVTG